MGGEVDPKCTPTVGFSPTAFQTEEYDICIFDLGGAANFRGIWVHYYHDCLGIIFVIDSAAEEAKLQESLEVLKETVQSDYIKGKPLLIFCNKKDLPNSRGCEEVISEEFLASVLEADTPHKILPTCGLEEDPNIDTGVEWLLEVVGKDYDRLAERVKSDTQKVKEEKERKRAERLAALEAEA
ncbi:Arf/Sar family, other [Angomonas deanei]|nr:Arf/Sar family, other [Angomonas deanei]|eukprot:EPY42048.1 Arf/Sar family, other [Angomonas deanei]